MFLGVYDGSSGDGHHIDSVAVDDERNRSRSPEVNAVV